MGSKMGGLGVPPYDEGIKSGCKNNTLAVSTSLQAARQLGASADLTVDLAAAVDTCPGGLLTQRQS